MISSSAIESVIFSWKISIGVSHNEMLPAFIQWEKDKHISPELKVAVWNHCLVQKSVHHKTAWIVRMPYYLSAPYSHREHENQKRTVTNAWPIIADMCTPDELDILIREENAAAARDNDDE